MQEVAYIKANLYNKEAKNNKMQYFDHNKIVYMIGLPFFFNFNHTLLFKGFFNNFRQNYHEVFMKNFYGVENNL